MPAGLTSRLNFFFGAQNFFYVKFMDVMYIKNKSLGCKECLSLNQTIIRQVEIIIRHEKAIFVRFKEIISWQIQESISAVKKSFFQTSTRLLFWCVEFFLRIFYASEYKLEHRTTRRNDYTTGESEFVEIQKMKHAYSQNIL